MKFIRILLIMSLLLFVNAGAATISGYAYCDLNQNGSKDGNETCTTEDIYAKIIYEADKRADVVVGPLYDTAGYYEFDTGDTVGTFRVIIDDNANAGDTVATPPPNIGFTSDPDDPWDGISVPTSDGQATYDIGPGNIGDVHTDQNYGMFFGADCVCDAADGSIIKKTINVDGNISDWDSVYADPDNNICDYACDEDKDAVVQSTGRNLVQFTWTGDPDDGGKTSIYAYGYTFRVGSSTNVQTFIYYTDRDGDGFIGDGGMGYDANGAEIGHLPDFAIVAGWHGSTGTTTFNFYEYIPANTDGTGDPMVWTDAEIGIKEAPGGKMSQPSWKGSGDGYTLNGHLDTKSKIEIIDLDGHAEGATKNTGGDPEDVGVKMEWRAKWSFLNLVPFQNITYHISAMNASVNKSNPPGQIDENMAGCYGEAVIRYCDVRLEFSESVTLRAYPTAPVYFEHNLTNLGNDDDNLTLEWIQTAGNFTPVSVTFYNDLNENGVEDSGEPELSSLVAIGLGESIPLLVKVELPAGLDNNFTVLEINATTTACEINHSAVVTDTINVLPWNFDLEVIKEVSDENEAWADTVTTNEGEPAFYRITVTNHGDDNATAVTVTDSLPDGVTYVSHIESRGTYVGTGVGEGQWTIGDLNVGQTETLEINVTVDSDAGSEFGTIIQNIAHTTDTAETNATYTEWADSDDANITAIHVPIATLQISKSISHNREPYETEDVNYTITVTNFGPDTAEDVVVEDVLPEYVSYTGDWNSTANYVVTIPFTFDGTTWTIGSMPSGKGAQLTFTVNVDSNATANNPHVNTACVSTTTLDANSSDANCSSAIFDASNEVDVGVVKDVNVSYPGEGDTILYTINVTNYGPINVTNLIIEDVLPSGVSYDSHLPADMNYSSGLWNIGDLNVSDLVTLTITATVDNGTAGSTIRNVASIDSLDQNDTNGTNDSDYATIIVEDPSIDIEKATNGQDADATPGPYVAIGSTVNWNYVVTNTGDVNLSGIIVTDDQGVAVDCSGQTTLTAGASMTCTGSGAATAGQYANLGSVTATTPSSATVTDSDPSHYYGETTSIDIEKATNGQDADAAPGPYVVIGSTVNWNYVVTNNSDVNLSDINVTDDQGVAVDCSGQTTLTAGASMTCTGSGAATAGQYANLGSVTATTPSSATVTDSDPSHYYGETTSIDIEKATNGQDADATPGPYVAIGSTVNWNYVVTNTGDVNLSGIIVTDDQGVAVDCSGQTTLTAGASMTCTGSGIATAGQYENNGSVEATTPAEASVTDSDLSHYYGETTSIDIEKATNGQDADATPGPYVAIGSTVNWNYVVTNNSDVTLTGITVTDDQGVAVDCSGQTTLTAGASMTCTGSGAATAGQYANLGSVTATTPSSATVTDSDPSHYYGETTSIDIEKATNGQDADAAPGPYVVIGSTVNWNYVVTNNSDVTLTGITVTDDQGVAVDCSGQTTLTAGASMTCTGSGAATAGQYANLGSVTATTPSSATVTDSDPSHYYGETTSIDIEKATNGQDADAAPGPYVVIGSTVNWNYVVTNNSDVTLTGITVTDDQGVAVDCSGQTTLTAGASMTCTGSGAATAGQYANLGSVTATTPSSATVTDSDPSHYYGETTSIDIEKATNGQDADAAPGPYVVIGSTVNWNYVVTNNSDVTLTGITVTDDQGVAVDCSGQTTLTAGASMTCTGSGAATAGQYANLGSVTATTPSSATVTDSDPSHYYGEDALIDIEKSTNGEDADTGTGPEVLPESTINWEYVITNNSNVDLTDINVTDDQEGAICTISTLAAGASTTCTATGIAIDGQYANTGTAMGRTPSGATVTDSDPSHYFGDPDCICEDIKSDSSSAMNKTVGALMILMTLMIGLFFVRREEQLNRNER